MRDRLTKQLSKVRNLLPLPKKKNQKLYKLTLNCCDLNSMESLLAELDEVRSVVTHLTLEDSLQRPDNVQLFNALQKLVTSDRCRLREILLVEPRVKAQDYRRWCFKKTNFLHHVYRLCQEKDIKVDIQGTLILETPPDKPQDVTSWLQTHFPTTIPQDKDITSLWISLRDVKPTVNNEVKPNGEEKTGPRLPQNTPRNGRRRRPPTAVEHVFQALVEVFNNHNRDWQFVHCHVLYTTVPKYAVPQTEALLEVAHVYDIPLRVQWQPLDDQNEAGTWIRQSPRAERTFKQQQQQHGQLQQRPGKHSQEDTTVTTDGSSRQFTL